MTPEESFLKSRQALINGGMVPCEAALALAGRNVTWPLWRWRVIRGWKLAPALTTNAEPPESRPVQPPGRASLYRGVYYDKGKKRWRARVVHEGKTTHLGHFSSEELAACAYDVGAILLHGPDAKLNFPRPLHLP